LNVLLEKNLPLNNFIASSRLTSIVGQYLALHAEMKLSQSFQAFNILSFLCSSSFSVLQTLKNILNANIVCIWQTVSSFSEHLGPHYKTSSLTNF